MSYYLTTKVRQEIGGNIKEARENKKMLQVEVAEAAGLNPSYYSKIERGTVNFSIGKFYKILRALGVKSSDLLPF